MAKSRWLRLLEEYEKYDIEVGRMHIKLSEILEKTPPEKRRRMRRL